MSSGMIAAADHGTHMAGQRDARLAYQPLGPKGGRARVLVVLAFIAGAVLGALPPRFSRARKERYCCAEEWTAP